MKFIKACWRYFVLRDPWQPNPFKPFPKPTVLTGQPIYKGETVTLRCSCGEDLDVFDFPVDQVSNEGIKTTKAETIHFATQMVLKDCPSCNPKFTGEKLELIYPEFKDDNEH